MPEYIEREAVLEKAYWHGKLPDFDNPYPDGVEAVDVTDIDEIPPADVVAVVRCKDCKHAKQHPIFPFSRRCKIEDYRLPHRADHFCSYGERRGEDG